MSPGVPGCPWGPAGPFIPAFPGCPGFPGYPISPGGPVGRERSHHCSPLPPLSLPPSIPPSLPPSLHRFSPSPILHNYLVVLGVPVDSYNSSCCRHCLSLLPKLSRPVLGTAVPRRKPLLLNRTDKLPTAWCWLIYANQETCLVTDGPNLTCGAASTCAVLSCCVLCVLFFKRKSSFCTKSTTRFYCYAIVHFCTTI